MKAHCTQSLLPGLGGGGWGAFPFRFGLEIEMLERFQIPIGYNGVGGVVLVRVEERSKLESCLLKKLI